MRRILLGVALFYLVMPAWPALAQQANKHDNRTGAVSWSYGFAACNYSDGVLVGPLLMTPPRVTMARYWAEPHDGELAKNQYIRLTQSLLGLQGTNWTVVADNQMYTTAGRLRNVKNWRQIKSPAMFDVIPTGYSAFRIEQTVTWFSPRTGRPEGSKSNIFTKYLAASSDGEYIGDSCPTAEPAMGPPVHV